MPRRTFLGIRGYVTGIRGNLGRYRIYRRPMFVYYYHCYYYYSYYVRSFRVAVKISKISKGLDEAWSNSLLHRKPRQKFTHETGMEPATLRAVVHARSTRPSWRLSTLLSIHAIRICVVQSRERHDRVKG